MTKSVTTVQQNKLIEAKIQRRRSRIVLKKKKSVELLKSVGGTTNASGTLAPPSEMTGTLATSAGLHSMLGSSLFSSSLGPSSSHGPLQFLRIRIADTADAGHVSTTIPAYVVFHGLAVVILTV